MLPRCYESDDVGANVKSNYFTKETCENDDFYWKVGKVEVDGETQNKGTCTLDSKYNIVSGLNKKDIFSDATLGDVLDTINNGRVTDVNIFENLTKDVKKDVVMDHDNQTSAVKGIVEETALSRYFFSEENTKNLQQTIRYRVYQKTNEIIDYQSSKDLYIVMRSILLQHGNFKVSANDMLNELTKLNKRVEVYCVNEYHQTFFNTRIFKRYRKITHSFRPTRI